MCRLAISKRVAMMGDCAIMIASVECEVQARTIATVASAASDPSGAVIFGRMLDSVQI
jgi:hypothetical protein